MTPKPLRFYFYQVIAGVNTYYIVDASGAVVTTTDKTIAEVDYSPEEWTTVEDGYERSESLQGIFTRLTSAYTFFGDGAKILNFHTLSKGYDATLKLLVEELQQDGTGFYYTEFANSDVDFPETDVDHVGTQIALTDKGLAQDIVQNLNTTLTIPMTGASQVYFAGTKVRSAYNYRYSGIRSQAIIDNVVGPGIGDGEFFTLLTVATTSEGLKPVAVQQNQEIYRMGLQSSNFFYRDEAYTKYLLLNSDNQPIDTLLKHPACEIRWKYESLGTGASPISAQFILYLIVAAPNAPFTFKTPIYTGAVVSTASGAFQIESVPAYAGFNALAPGERAYICGVIIQTTTTSGTFFIDMQNPETVEPRIEVESATKPSNVFALPQREMWDRAIKIIADGNYGLNPAASPLLNDATAVLADNYPYYTMYSNAMHLRGSASEPFKTTLGKIINGLQSRYASGIKVQDNIAVFDSLSTFYDDSITIADIGVLTGWSLKPSNEMGNRLIFGNDYDKTDVLNGLDDYNTKSEFLTPARFQKDKPLDFTSEEITSIQSIEKQRVQESGNNTTTSEISDKMFVYSVYPYLPPDGRYFLSYPNVMGGSVSGVFFPDTAYNVDLSPRRNALRLAPLINSFCFPSVTPIEFKSSERSSTLVSQFSASISVAENSAIIPDADCLYLPFILKGKSVKPLDLNLMMKTNPYGAVQGQLEKADGTLVDFRGFIKSVKIRPVARNDYDWEFVLAPSTDILKII